MSDLPTLWVKKIAVRVIPEGEAHLAKIQAHPPTLLPGLFAEYVPAAALKSAQDEVATLKALLSRAFKFTCHDHFIGPCAAEETRGAVCTCGLQALADEAKSTAALATKEPSDG